MTVAGERRIVSVLVADVAGSTGIAEQLGPERSKFLFDEVVALMRAEVERFGGTVAQLTGDGVLALFGAPTAHEDDSERAVRAALGLREALARYSAEVGPAYGIELGARVAVNTGPVVVPAAEAPPDVLYNALGDTVNVAARLQALGDLVVGPATARQVEGAFELEPLGQVELKGKAEHVSAFRVLVEREAAPKEPATSLIGRDAELRELEETLGGLADGRGCIVVVTGEPGIGKSRLKSEARDHYQGRIRFLEGHGVAYATSIPYWPFRELLRAWLGLGASEPEARVRLELKAKTAAAMGEEADEIYPFLASLLGLTLDGSLERRLRELSRDSVEQQTWDSVYRLVGSLAAQSPLCLVLDDLQWADESTLELLRELLPVTEQQAIGFMFLYRSEHEHAAWDLAEHARRRYRHRFRELDLEALPEDDTRRLAAGAAGAELPASVEALLAERSGGNPFFLEEALRDLIERGALRRDNGRFELASKGELGVPALVQEALQARLDRLGTGARDVVGVAAVIGRTFGLPLLEEVVAREELLPALSELQRLDLVVEERRRPTSEYRFRHGLVQEVAYQRLVSTRRRDLHRVVGEALEALHTDSPEEVYGLLAHHFSEADDSERAVDYLLKAGDAARQVNADREAIDHYRAALRFLRGTGDESRARDTLLNIALAHHLAFDFERAGRAYEEAFSYGAPQPSRLEPTERIEIGFPAHFENPVPGFVYSPQGWEVTRHLYRGLLAVGREFEVLPDLADRFDVSPDGLVYRFRLRPDARWSDGVPVTADDFVLTWARMRDEGVETAFLLEDVDSATALDAATLEVRLQEPRNYFPYLLAQPPFFAWPTHLSHDHETDWREALPRVGNGPFVLAALDERHALLVANRAWHGTRGNVREIEVEFTPVGDAGALDAGLTGRLVAFPFVDTPLADTALANTVVESLVLLGTWYVGFNADRPPFSDARVRAAFAHGLVRNRLAAAAGRVAEPAVRGGFIPPAMPGHSHSVGRAYDRDAALRLLAEAGFPDGRGLGPIEIAVLASWPQSLNRELTEQLARIGVQSNVTRLPYEGMFGGIESAQAWVWGFSADYLDPVGMIAPLFETVPLYRDAEIAALLARARSLPDQDERLQACRELERRWIGEQAALVPYAYMRLLTLRRPWVEGLWMNSLGSSTLGEVVVRPELRP